MAKTEKPDKAKKTIIDVTHADSAPPSPNSKSVIVTNRPILKDPMVVDEAADSEASSGDKPAKSSAPSIAELAEAAAQKNQPEKEAAAKPEKKIEPAAGPPAEKEDAAKPAAKEPEKPDIKESETEEPDQPDKVKPAQEAEAEAAKAAEHDAAIEKLIEGKQYYLPINSIEKRRSKRFVAGGILLSLLLIVAWADIALDAGLIQVSGIKPLTHFFSN
jgi:hypothetical protein